MSDTEEFWRGEFGDAYTSRNRVPPEQRAGFWRDIIMATRAKSALEVGCNYGPNLQSIRSAAPDVRLVGCDLNQSALLEARSNGFDVFESKASKIGSLVPPGSFDLVYTCGVLIHVPPEELDATLDGIIKASKRYILAVEYPAGKEEAVSYRGHEGKLWRRPYWSLYEAKGLKTLSVVICAPGFDRCTAWLLEK